MSIDTSLLENAKFSWPANAEYGIDSFELEIPADLNGRVDVWKVPTCDAYPEGYFVAISRNRYFEGVEPGCLSWEKTLLAKVAFFGVPNSSEDINRNVVEYVAPGIELDDSQLNPNDFSSLLPSEE